jgi:hypothetical protein
VKLVAKVVKIDLQLDYRSKRKGSVMISQKNQLEFHCQQCKHPISLPIFQLELESQVQPWTISCSHCQKKYLFQDETLKRQLKKFAALCQQLQDSEEILGQTAVGIDVGEHRVKVPYKLLLTRLNSLLELRIGEEDFSFVFRVEPLKLINS